MGNTGLSRLWESPTPQDESGELSLSSGEAIKSILQEEDCSSGSSDYRSAQEDSFSEDGKQVSNSSIKNQPPSVVSTQCTLIMENKVQANVSKEVLQVHYSDLLVDITHPYSLVSDLLRKQILDRDIGNVMLNDHFTRREKMAMLINAIIMDVSKNPANFQVIVAVLENRPFHHSIARLLLQSYGTLLAGNKIPEFTYSTTTLKYAEELKASYIKLSTVEAHAAYRNNIYNLRLIRNGINSTRNRRIIFQSSAFNKLKQSLFKDDSITCTDIFNFDIDTEYILIEGEQCVGKTELVREICQSWDKIPALGKYQLILQLDFKKRHLQDIQNLEGLICDCDPCVKQHIIQEVCDANGKNVLIIMDSFEKLPHTITRNHDSFIVQLLAGKLLPKSTKLITATPSVTRYIVSSYDLSNIRHIQQLGFHEEHIEICTAKVNITSPKQQQISSQQILMYLPVNTFMVTKYHHKSIVNNWDIPKTLTQYYSLYCFDLIWEYLSNNNINPDLLQYPLHSFNNLHPDIHRKVMELSKLALIETIQANTCSDKIKISDDLVNLGLMSTSCQDQELEVSFVNYMLQAFLAAHYISQLEDSEQDKIFFNHSLGEMSIVWRFVAGLSGITETILEVLKSSVEDLQHLPFILSLLCEHQDENIVKDVLEDDSIITYSLSFPEESRDLTFQCFALGYCIAASNCVWNLNLSACNLKEADLKALVNGLSSVDTTGEYTINSLQLDKNFISHNKILILSELSLHEIRSLNLSSCCLTQESLDYLAASLIPSIPHLQALDIGNNHIHGQTEGSLLLNSLVDLLELQTLNLDDTALNLQDMVPLNMLLNMPGSTLTQLSIGGKDMPPDSINLLTDTVLTQSSIETLRISDLDLTGNNDTFALLETNTNLNRLVFFECCFDLIHLATSLCMNTTLKQLEIFYPLSDAEYDIGPQCIIALTDMLEVNRSLSELSLYSYKPLERSKVLSLAETLKYNRSLEILQLPYHYSQYFSTSELSIIDPRVYWKVWPCIK